MTARYFKSPAEFRAWLQKHHATKRELIVGYYKKHASRRGISYLEAVDEALAFGWIDGIVRRVDEERYCQRFSPRTKNSTWSAVNIRKAKALIKSGRMAPAGEAAFRARKRGNTNKYSYENRPQDLPPACASKFRRNGAAWSFFAAQTPSYRRTATWFVVSAVKDETRQRRLDILIDMSARGLRLEAMKPLDKP